MSGTRILQLAKIAYASELGLALGRSRYHEATSYVPHDARYVMKYLWRLSGYPDYFSQRLRAGVRFDTV